jgi:threonyl-tRNA synthetase
MEERYMQAANALNLLAIGQSAGVVYWKPSGLKLYENLKNFIRKHHEDRNYLEVKSPSLVASEVFEQSGHSEKYRENMFFIGHEDQYALRPMSCPNHILIYQSEKRSYKQLPMPIFEFGEVFRNEPSGSLQLLFRQRQFCQDDSHVFVSEDKLISAISNYLIMSKQAYCELGFEEVNFAISLRPQKRFGNDEQWDKAENALRQACDSHNIIYEELPGEGAFYGPKIELKVKDKLGRSWQLGTLQLDYVLPERFDLEFINAEGQFERPIILHHAVLGSLERMIGILLENFGKDLPSFIHPYPAVVISVSEKSVEYGKAISKKVGAIFDSSDEPLGKKLKNWRNKGVPKIYVVGEKEALNYKQNNIMEAVLNEGNEKLVVHIN